MWRRVSHLKPDLTTFNQSSVGLANKNIYAENKIQYFLFFVWVPRWGRVITYWICVKNPFEAWGRHLIYILYKHSCWDALFYKIFFHIAHVHVYLAWYIIYIYTRLRYPTYLTNPALETSHELWHYFTEEECIEPTAKVRRELTPEHTGYLLALEKRLLSQLLHLLAACKKSKPELSTTTPTTTVLIDTTTTPGERTCIWFDNQWEEQWSTDGLHPSSRTRWNMCFHRLSSS